VFENLANQENSDSTAVDQMSHEQRMVFALTMLRQGSTDSGGFDAYFRHAGGKTTPQAAEAARIVAHEQALSGAELDHSVDVFNVEVGDGPRALGNDAPTLTRCEGTLSATSHLASTAERHAALFETRSAIEARPNSAVAGGTEPVAA
jgi:hypothetical protein